jgi:hypothetical protein
MSLSVALALLLLAPSVSKACEVLLRNASGVDLMLYVDSRTVLVGPGESQRIPLFSLSIIEFGAESHEFAVGGAAKALCPAAGTAELEARADGKLWLRSEGQPEGMPLVPVRVLDLTGSPPNNSFKPKPLRGSA